MKEILEMKRTHEKIVAKRKLREEQLKDGKGLLPPQLTKDYPITKQTTATEHRNKLTNYKFTYQLF